MHQSQGSFVILPVLSGLFSLDDVVFVKLSGFEALDFFVLWLIISHSPVINSEQSPVTLL